MITPNKEMMELLLLNQANLYDNDNNTLLYFAAENGNDVALQFLIENGACDEMKKHRTEILKKLRHCDVGIDSQYLKELEDFLEERGLNPEKHKISNKYDQDSTKQIIKQDFHASIKIQKSSNGKIQEQNGSDNNSMLKADNISECRLDKEIFYYDLKLSNDMIV